MGWEGTNEKEGRLINGKVFVLIRYRCEVVSDQSEEPWPYKGKAWGVEGPMKKKDD